MFDYSKKQENREVLNIDQKLYKRPISKTVREAIRREIGLAPIKKVIEMNTQTLPDEASLKDIDLESKDNVVYDYKQDKINEVQSSTEKNGFTETVQSPTIESSFGITATEINLSTQKEKRAYSYEYVPDFDRAERLSDQTGGEIQIGYSLTGLMNTQTGVIQSQGQIPTRIEINLENKGINVPLINEEGMQAFLQKKGLAIEGNLILVARNQDIIDSELDSGYAKKFYFNKNIQELPSISNASYLLFAGVKTGNVLIRYQLKNKEIAQKIIYVGDGEMSYEQPMFNQSSREIYSFTTRNLLGQKNKELNISGDLINYFATTNLARKKSLNNYEMKIPETVNGMRKYFEFKHLKDSVFVGTWDNQNIEIPGNEFIGKVLEMNQINSLKDRCVVQVNLSKDLRDLKVNGKNRSGEMFVETSSLDRDGNFTKDNFEGAEKLFITGDLEGIFSMKLDYTDGTSEFVKTFCSEGTYLVEQL